MLIEERLLNRLLRRKFQKGLRDLENLEMPTLTVCKDELWDRIVEEIDKIEIERTKRGPTKPHSLAFFSLLAASIGVLCFLPSGNFDLSRSKGTKSAHPEFAVLPTSNLAFAILKANGDIIRGSKATQILNGDALIFYLETPGLFQGTNFSMDILVQTPNGKLEIIVDKYRVQSSSETMKGRGGFIVYKPDSVGIYRFSGTRNFENNSENVPGFSIEQLN